MAVTEAPRAIEREFRASGTFVNREEEARCPCQNRGRICLGQVGERVLP